MPSLSRPLVLLLRTIANNRIAPRRPSSRNDGRACSCSWLFPAVAACSSSGSRMPRYPAADRPSLDTRPVHPFYSSIPLSHCPSSSFLAPVSRRCCSHLHHCVSLLHCCFPFPLLPPLPLPFVMPSSLPLSSPSYLASSSIFPPLPVLTDASRLTRGKG
jgi:hypothetical protein